VGRSGIITCFRRYQKITTTTELSKRSTGQQVIGGNDRRENNVIGVAKGNVVETCIKHG